MKWYESAGAENDVVVSTRIRLARNLKKHPFPENLDEEQKKQINQQVLNVMKSVGPQFGEFQYADMTCLQHRDALAMVERHLISPQFAQCIPGSAVLYTKDESVSLMLMEEDHIRMQVMSPGMNLDEAYSIADKLDTALDRSLHFAFDNRLGFLTQCPTNLGTAMRASLMLHLPALQERGALQQLANTVSKLGLTIRGLYGEGSQPQGALYQLSNQVTLGISEKDAIENLKGIANQIIREERSLREQMKANPKFDDRIWRSLGILKTARVLSSEEFMTLISSIRLGKSLGILPELSLEKLTTLINEMQPAMLMQQEQKDLDPDERDLLRAARVREQLAG